MGVDATVFVIISEETPKHARHMSRFLLAASCISFLPAVHAANWLPTSPLVQVGDDIDIFFDSSVAIEVTDNLYSAANAKSATNWTVTPGLAFEYGKDTPISLNLTAKRSYVYFNKAEYRSLEDSRDALSGNLRFASGGPLTVTLDSSYRVSARNDNLALDGVSPNVFSATLVRQANYSHAIDIDMRMPAHRFMEIRLPEAGGSTQDLAVGPDRNLWVIQQNPARLLRVSPLGELSKIPLYL